MTALTELWTRGLGMVVAGYWPALLLLIVVSVVLATRRKWVMSIASVCLILIVAPFAQIFYWEMQTESAEDWIGRWSGDQLVLELVEASADTLSGNLVSGPCRSGVDLLGQVSGQEIELISADGQLYANFKRDGSSIVGTFSGCANGPISVELTLGDTGTEGSADASRTEYLEEFQIDTPEGWGAAPLVGRMVWHVAAGGGTTLPDCGVTVTADSSFRLITNDEYIAGQSAQRFRSLLRATFSDVVIESWETDFELGQQRGLQIIYSGTLDGVRQTTVTIQTMRDGKLFSFGCNHLLEEFPARYVDFLHIADTFRFVE